MKYKVNKNIILETINVQNGHKIEKSSGGNIKPVLGAGAILTAGVAYANDEIND